MSSVLFSLYLFAAKGELLLAIFEPLSERFLLLRFTVYTYLYKCVTPPRFCFVCSFVIILFSYLSSHTYSDDVLFIATVQNFIGLYLPFFKIRSCGSLYFHRTVPSFLNYIIAHKFWFCNRQIVKTSQ